MNKWHAAQVHSRVHQSILQAFQSEFKRMLLSKGVIRDVTGRLVGHVQAIVVVSEQLS